MTTAYVYDKRFEVHTMEGHPEYAGRLVAVADQFDENGLNDQLLWLDVHPASYEAVAAVHTGEYLNRLEQASANKSPIMFGLDTYVTPQSYDIARLAAGGVIGVTDAVLRGEAENGLAAIRPPGHHALPSIGMGFCLLNNIAIAARYAQRELGVERILIVDIDVHHGNGTQDTFYFDPDVLFISMHQSPLYPGTGAIFETGAGPGEGATVNIPLPPGVGDQGYQRVYNEIVLPLAQRFAPQIVLVSVGFDAHWADPLANMRLSLSGYAQLFRKLIHMAGDLCAGKIVFVLEGGYNLRVLANGWSNLAYALLGSTKMVDSFGTTAGTEPDITQIVVQLKQLHGMV